MLEDVSVGKNSTQYSDSRNNILVEGEGSTVREVVTEVITDVLQTISRTEKAQLQNHPRLNLLGLFVLDQPLIELIRTGVGFRLLITNIAEVRGTLLERHYRSSTISKQAKQGSESPSGPGHHSSPSVHSRCSDA